jgi:hypothetical protein
MMDLGLLAAMMMMNMRSTDIRKHKARSDDPRAKASRAGL